MGSLVPPPQLCLQEHGAAGTPPRPHPNPEGLLSDSKVLFTRPKTVLPPRVNIPGLSGTFGYELLRTETDRR